MLVSLPMYDFAEMHDATVDIWNALRQEIVRRCPSLDVPEQYMPATEIADLVGHWCDSSLLFSQTCGFPLTHALKGRVQYVATPVYGAPGCSPEGHYCSFIIVRKDTAAQSFNELRDASFAFNEYASQSGFNAVRWMTQADAGIDPEHYFSNLLQSGGHRQSMKMVAAGEADLCAVDCVTFALIARFAPAEVKELRILDQTPSAPALPYITSLSTSPETLQVLRGSLQALVKEPTLQTSRQALFLENIQVLPLQSYNRICDISVA